MKLITLQNKKVFEILQREKIYRSDFNYIIKSPFCKLTTQEEIEEENLVHSYQILMSHYDYITPPIFCCIPDSLVNFEGTNRHSNVLLELDVPDEFVNLHLFSKWKEILKIIKYSDWTTSMYKLFKDYLDGKYTDRELTVQAVVPYIKPEWFISAYNFPTHYIDFYKDKYFSYD